METLNAYEYMEIYLNQLIKKESIRLGLSEAKVMALITKLLSKVASKPVVPKNQIDLIDAIKEAETNE